MDLWALLQENNPSENTIPAHQCPWQNQLSAHWVKVSVTALPPLKQKLKLQLGECFCGVGCWALTLERKQDSSTAVLLFPSPSCYVRSTEINQFPAALEREKQNKMHKASSKVETDSLLYMFWLWSETLGPSATTQRSLEVTLYCIASKVKSTNNVRIPPSWSATRQKSSCSQCVK